MAIFICSSYKLLVMNNSILSCFVILALYLKHYFYCKHGDIVYRWKIVISTIMFVFAVLLHGDNEMHTDKVSKDEDHWYVIRLCF